MKIPKFLEKIVLESEQVNNKIDTVKEKITKDLKKELRTEYNKEITSGIKRALKGAKKDWAFETVKAIDNRFKKPRKYVSSSGYGTDSFLANILQSGKNYNTLSILFSDSPGSIQCASRIRDAVIGSGYVIKPSIEGKKGSKKDLKRLIDFFDSPNPDDTIETLLGVCIENYLAYGNFYLEKVPTRRGKDRKRMEVAELYNLDPTAMTILIDAEKKKKGVIEKVGYKRRTEVNKSVIYNLDEILQIRRPSRRAALYGRAVLEDNTATLQLLLRALTYNINILRNGGRPPIQLILPDDSTESDADAVSSWFEKNYMGAHNAGKTLISFKGAKAEALGLSPQDMAYLELLNFGLREVAGQYGVPLILVGFPEGTNRATASEARRSFYLTNIFPLRKLISQKITKIIIKDGMGIEGWRLDFKTAGLEESESSRRDFMTAWGKGLYTFNEARIAMGLLPIDEEWANKHYLLGTKNDSLIQVDKAIGRIPETSSPDDKQNKPERGRGEENPEEDESSNDKG